MMNREDYDFGEALIKDDYLLASNIYVDLSFLKYFELGKFVSSASITAELYNKVISYVFSGEFEKRATNELKYLTGIEDISDYYYDELPDDKLLLVAPSFDHAIELIQRVVSVTKINAERLGSEEELVIHLDLGHLDISEEMRDLLAKEYMILFNAKVKVISSLSSAVKDDCIFDIFLVGDIFYFNKAMVGYMNDGKLVDKKIVCSRLLRISKMDDKDPDNFGKVFDAIDIVMKGVADFKFIDPFPCIKGD